MLIKQLHRILEGPLLLADDSLVCDVGVWKGRRRAVSEPSGPDGLDSDHGVAGVEALHSPEEAVFPK